MFGDVRRAGPILAAMAGASFALAQAFPVSGMSPTLIAFCLALAAANSGLIDDRRRANLASTGRLAAQIAVALLGLNISVSEIASLGAVALPIILVSLAGTLIGTIWLGRLLGVGPNLASLIAAGSAICGASAILAVSSTRKSGQEEATYAVACVTVVGMAGMLFAAPAGHALGLSPAALGVWIGAALQEVAQVLGALPAGTSEQTFATVAKLARIVMLPLVIVILALSERRLSETPRKPGIRWKLPMFLYGFLALALLRSTGAVPDIAIAVSTIAVTSLLSIALAGLAIGVRLEVFSHHGWRPLVLSVLAAMLIAAASLSGILLAGL